MGWCGILPARAEARGFTARCRSPPSRVAGLDTQNMEKTAGWEEIYLSGVPSVTSGAVGCSPGVAVALRPRLLHIAIARGRPAAPAPRWPRRAVPEPPSAIPARRNELYLHFLSTLLDFTAVPTLARRTPVGALLLRRLKQSILLSGIFLNVAKTAFALSPPTCPALGPAVSSEPGVLPPFCFSMGFLLLHLRFPIPKCSRR